MSGTTCQFCGKPLWRLRRGSDAEFCSREHRNQYKLRMGLSQLVEADKLATLRRKRDNCNLAALYRPAGPPELQTRPCSSWKGVAVSSQLALPHPVLSPDGEARLRSNAGALSLVGWRQAASKPRTAGAVAFGRREPSLRSGAPLRPRQYTTGTVPHGRVRDTRVTLADGGLSRPIFLIARFVARRPSLPSVAESRGRPLPDGRGSVAGFLNRGPQQPVSVAPAGLGPAMLPTAPRRHETRRIPTIESRAPRLPLVRRHDEIAGIARGGTLPIPFRVVDSKFRIHAPEPRFLRPAASVSFVLLDLRCLRVTTSSRASRAWRWRETASGLIDSARERASARLSWTGRPPLVPRNRVREHNRFRALRPRPIAPVLAAGRSMAPRSAAPPVTRMRGVEKGRRAGWTSRAQFRNGQARELLRTPGNRTAQKRDTAVPCSISLAVGSVRATGIATGSLTASAAALRLAYVPGAPAGPRHATVAPPPRDLFFEPKLPGLKGDLVAAEQTGEAGPLEDDFSRGLAFWSGDTSGWKLDVAGVRPAGAALFTPSFACPDSRVEFLARIERGGLICLIRASDTENYHAVRFASTGAVERFSVFEGQPESPVAVGSAGAAAGKALNVEMCVRGDSFSVAVNGNEIGRWSDDRLSKAGFGFAAAPQARARLYWIRISPAGPEISSSGIRQS